MRIESVSRPAGSGEALHAPLQAQPGPGTHARAVVDDDVELHAAPQPLMQDGFDLAMLQALIQGLLQQLTAHPVLLSPLQTATAHYGGETPAWMSSARQALNRPGHGLLRIQANGRIVPTAGAAQSFALDLQLPNLFQIREPRILVGSFVPSWSAAGLENAQAEFSLRAEADTGPDTDARIGGALFVRCTLADETEIRELAARVLPHGGLRPALPRAVLHGDEHFVTTDTLADNRHDLDISV